MVKRFTKLTNNNIQPKWIKAVHVHALPKICKLYHELLISKQSFLYTKKQLLLKYTFQFSIKFKFSIKDPFEVL